MGVVEDELVALHRARPMILVMPFGSTGSFTDEEWANGVGAHDGWETFVARDLVHAVDGRYRTIAVARGRVLAGLSEGGYGALNIGIHHPREFATLESWSGYQRADDIGSIFGHRRRLLRRELAAASPSRGGACARAHAHLLLVLQRHRRPLRAAERAFARELDTDSGSRTATSSCAAATTGRSGAATPRDAYLAASEARACVGSGSSRCRCSSSASSRPAGCTSSSRALPGPRVGEALPLDELSRHAAAPLLWFIVVWGALGVAARALRALGAGRAA